MRRFTRTPLAIAAVALTTVFALGAGATPMAAQEADWTDDRSWADHRSQAHGVWWRNAAVSSQPGFGSWHARVEFDEGSDRFVVDVGRVGLDRVIVGIRGPVFYPMRRSDRDEPWYAGLGILDEGEPHSGSTYR